MSRAVLYCRQSLGRPGEDAQSSLSLDSQEERQRRLCAERGWSVVEVVRDHDLRADDPTRPGLARVVELVERKLVDAVIVHAVDRFAGDIVLQELTWRRIKRAGATLVSVTEPHADNDFVRGLYGLIAQERKAIQGHKLSAAFTQLQRRGRHHGKAPYGYAHDAGGIVPDEDEAAVVERIFDWSLRGVSAHGIADRLAAEGVPPRHAATWSSTTVVSIIGNPVHAGGLRIGGEVAWPLPGTVWHAPIITREVWEEVQARRTRRGRVRVKPASSWLEGHVYHACGKRMYLVNQRQTFGDWVALRCCHAFRAGTARCRVATKEVSARNAEVAVRVALERDLSSVLSVQEAVEASERDAGASEAIAARKRLEKGLAGIGERWARAEALYLDGRRGADWLKEQEGTLDAERARIEGELAALPVTRTRGELTAAITALEGVGDAVRKMSDEQLGVLLAGLGDVVVEDRHVRVRYLPHLAAVLPTPARVEIRKARR